LVTRAAEAVVLATAPLPAAGALAVPARGPFAPAGAPTTCAGAPFAAARRPSALAGGGSPSQEGRPRVQEVWSHPRKLWSRRQGRRSPTQGCRAAAQERRAPRSRPGPHRRALGRACRRTAADCGLGVEPRGTAGAGNNRGSARTYPMAHVRGLGMTTGVSRFDARRPDCPAAPRPAMFCA